MKTGRILGALTALLFTGGAAAWAGGATTKLQDAFKFGEHWYGPKYTMDDLKGRVVLLEDWGYN